MQSVMARLWYRIRYGRRWKRYINDNDSSWLFPPENLEDVAAWDHHWDDQIAHGLPPSIFDMLVDDRRLVTMMNAEGMRTILCAGNGVSQEPRALAAAGFEVVALDFSRRAAEIAQSVGLTQKGFEHFIDPEMLRPGGKLESVVGDILDSNICPGPFDVVIERRTAQLYLDRGMDLILGSLAKRLGPNGMLFSHCHDAAWNPSAEPRHFTASWFVQNGWNFWNGDSAKPPGRVACLSLSTG